MNETGIVFDIQRFSISDGPGIRTTVFLKGCNLMCRWCHNPESHMAAQELQYLSAKCAACGVCVSACSYNVHSLCEGTHILDRSKCRQCGECAQACLSGALKILGKAMTVDTVIAEVARDAELYRFSQGGMTVSGGEPMLQMDFLEALIRAAKDMRIHTAIETAGCVGYDRFERLGDLPDIYLYDFKGFDEARHIENTGVSNRLILENLRRLAKKKNIVVRMPLIAGINDDSEQAKRTAEYFSLLPCIEHIELLPYHNFGEGKYTAIGRPVERFAAPSSEHMREIADILESSGKKVLCRKSANSV